MHLYVPWDIQDYHASICPLGHIGFSCIYMSLGTYRIFMHLYVPWDIQDFHVSICPLGHIGFTCIYMSLGSLSRPIWPDIFCKFHPLRGLYNRGRGIYVYINPFFLELFMSLFQYLSSPYDGQEEWQQPQVEKEPSPLSIGQSSASVCVAHQGWGSSYGSAAMVQRVQVTPSKIKGKLHSA